MKAAETCRAESSTDLSFPTGAVVVKDVQIIGRGANQSALRNKKLLEFHKDVFCVRRFLRIPTGKKYWICPGCSSSRHHAESRAVKDAQKKGMETKGADLYLYGHWWCCEPCWKVMMDAGIRNVYLLINSEIMFGKR